MQHLFVTSLVLCGALGVGLVACSDAPADPPTETPKKAAAADPKVGSEPEANVPEPGDVAAQTPEWIVYTLPG